MLGFYSSKKPLLIIFTICLEQVSNWNSFSMLKVLLFFLNSVIILFYIGMLVLSVGYCAFYNFTSTQQFRQGWFKHCTIAPQESWVHGGGQGVRQVSYLGPSLKTVAITMTRCSISATRARRFGAILKFYKLLVASKINKTVGYSAEIKIFSYFSKNYRYPSLI